MQPMQVTLRSGHAVTIRSGDPAEAPHALPYLLEMHRQEPQFLLAEADELEQDGGAKLAERWTKLRDDPRSVHFVAWADGEVVGDAMFQGGAKRRVYHTGWLGVGIRPAWQGRGLGRTLMELLLGWASSHPEIERVQLKVYCDNHRAVAMYRSMGFVEECRSVRAFRLADGTYADEFSMCVYVKPDAPEGFRCYSPGGLAGQ
ncbi:MAG: GNAT family N-acetyltransferase [Phycisphaerales bacterium]|nr:GNAT family N-acetyltransferase [Phycisphaerales bacterium]